MSHKLQEYLYREQRSTDNSPSQRICLDKASLEPQPRPTAPETNSLLLGIEDVHACFFIRLILLLRTRLVRTGRFGAYLFFGQEFAQIYSTFSYCGCPHMDWFKQIITLHVIFKEVSRFGWDFWIYSIQTRMLLWRHLRGNAYIK